MSNRYLLLLSTAGVCIACAGSVDGDGNRDDDSVSATGGAPTLATGGGNNSDGSDPGGTGARNNNTGGTANGSGGLDLGMGGGGTGGEGTGGETEIPHVPIPSAGCALSETPAETLEIEVGPIYLSLPPTYDGQTLLPLIIGFHAASDNFSGLVNGHPAGPNPLPDDYIIARPRAAVADNTTWEGLHIEEYDAVYQALEEKVCFDESRVFGVGSGGGSRFLSRMVCEPRVEGIVRPGDFRALGLVGRLFTPCAAWRSLPLLHIHSEDGDFAFGADPDGQIGLEKLRARQECEQTSLPAHLASSFYGNYSCEDFDGCSSPLRFCSHDISLSFDEWLPFDNVVIETFFADYL